MKFIGYVCTILIITTHLLFSMEKSSEVTKDHMHITILCSEAPTQKSIVNLSNEQAHEETLTIISQKMDDLGNKMDQLQQISSIQSKDINALRNVANTCQSLLVPTALAKARDCYQKQEYDQAKKLFQDITAHDSDVIAKQKAQQWLIDINEELNADRQLYKELMEKNYKESTMSLAPHLRKGKEELKKIPAYAMLKRLAYLNGNKQTKAKACMYLADLYLEQYQPLKAIKYLSIASEIEEIRNQQLLANERLGRINWKLNFVGDAYAHLNKIIELYGPDLNKTDIESQSIEITHNQCQRIWRWLGVVLYTQEKFKDAREYFEKATTAAPLNDRTVTKPSMEDREAEAIAHACFGDILVRGLGDIQKDSNQGYALLKKAIELNSSNEAFTIASKLRANAAYNNSHTHWYCTLV